MFGIRPFGPFVDKKDLLHRHSAVQRHRASHLQAGVFAKSPSMDFCPFDPTHSLGSKGPQKPFESPLLLASLGAGGIRTPGTLTSSMVFETISFNRSDTAPVLFQRINVLYLTKTFSVKGRKSKYSKEQSAKFRESIVIFGGFGISCCTESGSRKASKVCLEKSELFCTIIN